MPDPLVLSYKGEFAAVFDAGIAANQTVAAHLFGPELPDNAVITRAWWEVATAFAGGAGATLSLGLETDAAAGIRAATLVTDAMYATTGFKESLLTGGTAQFLKAGAAGRQLVATVAVAALTAGKLVVHCEWTVGE